MAASAAKQIVHSVDDVFDDVLHHLGRLTRHLGEETGDAMSSTAVIMARSATDLLEAARTESKTLAERAGKEVREHPAATAAIAAAAVAMIGLAIAHRRRAA